MNYRNYIQNYVKDLLSSCGPQGYAPLGFALENTSMSDKELYSFALGIYNMAKSGNNHNNHVERKSETPHHHDRMFYLVPHAEPDGSFYYIDRFTNKVVISMHKEPNGLFSYLGPESMTALFGGRGQMSTLNQNLEDGDFFRTKKAA